jgi:putative peptidoglycan lipid II flippase
MVQRVLKLFYGEIRGLHKAAYILAFFALGSQLLALVRDRLLAHSFGTSLELDLYYAAFRIPDLLFVLFASVLSVYVLLPFVTKARAKSGGDAGVNILSQMFSLFLIVYTLVAGILFLLAPFIMPYLLPGFINDMDTLVTLTRILLIQPFLLGISSLCGVVTQLESRFVLYAISPLLYNVGIIIGIIFLYPSLGLMGLVWGVVLGALAHLAIQIPIWFTSPLRFRVTSNYSWSLLKDILVVAMPRAITLSLHQVVLLVMVGLATLLTAGSVSVFQFAFNLQSVPIAIIGMSYSVAAFPVLADLLSRGERLAFIKHLETAIRHIIFWSLPLMALIIVIRAQIVRVVLGSGQFSWNDTRLTAALLAVFVVGLVGQALLLLLVRAFYAGGNTRTPLFVALFSAGVTISLTFLLMFLYKQIPALGEYLVLWLRLEGVQGTEVLLLGLAFTTGVLIELLLLATLLSRSFAISWRPIVRPLYTAVLAALVAGVSAYVTLNFVVEGVNQETFLGILIQGLVAGVVGLCGAGLFYAAMESRELDEVLKSLKAKLTRSEVLAPQSDAP